MKWADKWGEQLATGYYLRLMEKGFLKEEDLEPDVGPFRFYLEAYHELSSCRSSGMSLGPIPFTAIVEYFSLYDIGDFEDFRYLIRRMDNAFLSMMAKKSEGKKSSNARSNSSKTN